MSTITAVSRERFLGKSWIRPTSVSFAKDDSVVPLVLSELPVAMMHMPIALMLKDKQHQLVGLQGFGMGGNLSVTPQGQWTGPYIPKHYRYYPFMLAGTTEGNRALCVDEVGLQLGEPGEGLPFFNDNGEPAERLTQVMQELVALETERQQTSRLCSLIAELELVEAWDITLKDQDVDRKIQGLQKINETRLNTLDGEQLVRLRNLGGLAACYCQLLSMQNLSKLVKQLKERMEGEKQGKDLLQAFGMSSDNDLLSFENL